MPDRSKVGRNNKARGKDYERLVAEIVGGVRFPADVGGKLDVDHELLAIQVRSRANVNQTIAEGLQDARQGAEEAKRGQIPCLVLIDRSRAKLGKYVIFDLEEFNAKLQESLY